MSASCRPSSVSSPRKAFAWRLTPMWWIRAVIHEYIMRSWSLVKMGTTANQKKLFFNLQRAKSQISAFDEGDLRPIKSKKIAERLGVVGTGRRRHEPADGWRRLAQLPRARRTARANGRTGSSMKPRARKSTLIEREEASNRLDASANRARRRSIRAAPHFRRRGGLPTIR